jgi:hypothetical protein
MINRFVAVVIPALNEESALPCVLRDIPRGQISDISGDGQWIS